MHQAPLLGLLLLALTQRAEARTLSRPLSADGQPRGRPWVSCEWVGSRGVHCQKEVRVARYRLLPLWERLPGQLSGMGPTHGHGEVRFVQGCMSPQISAYIHITHVSPHVSLLRHVQDSCFNDASCHGYARVSGSAGTATDPSVQYRVWCRAVNSLCPSAASASSVVAIDRAGGIGAGDVNPTVICMARGAYSG